VTNAGGYAPGTAAKALEGQSLMRPQICD